MGLYPNINFPDSVDTFVQMLNIVASDGNLIKQYQAAMEAGNQTLANQIFAQIPNASQKVIDATKLNKLINVASALEQFYLTDIQPYVTQKQTEWQNIVNLFSYEGIYSPGNTYLKNNFVDYTVQGVTYLYIAIGNPPVGTSPTNTTYWRPLTIRGEKGASGGGMTYLYEWSPAETYTAQNTVTYDGKVWGSLKTNSNTPPDTDPLSWELLAYLTPAQYPFQPNRPADLVTGDLWFRTF